MTVLTVQTDGDLSEFGQLAFGTFGFPIDIAPIAFTADLCAVPQIDLFLGRVDGVPACCSMLLSTGTVAGIYWVGVDSRYRRQGLGSAITRHALRVAVDRGLTVATLQASKRGEPVYRRLGFETVRSYLRFDRDAR